jgi:dihydrofolate synthase/folylpolyglutamate synthase
MERAIKILTVINQPDYVVKRNNINFLKLMDIVGHPYQSFRSIHITGTNGKGSVALKVAKILQKAGYRTGIYTSPHLFSFRERIRVNEELISKD